MERLFETYYRLINSTDTTFIRFLDEKIDWQSRLIGIRGARGCGKTTLLLQHIKKKFRDHYSKALYVSLDNIWFSNHSLVELADYFIRYGGKYLFLDEVHKYPNWAIEIKNLYDSYPSLNIVFTGSSLLEIIKGRADLSRRALMYELHGLSFREFVSIKTKQTFPTFSLEELFTSHTEISQNIVNQIKVFPLFNNYLKYGYYPYFLEGVDNYHSRLQETLLMILEHELPLLRGVDLSYTPKLKKLLAIIGESVPFIPNVSKLSERIGINRLTFITYLNYLNEAKIIHLLYRKSKGISQLQKPDKIFLQNPNLIYLLGSKNENIGNVRETFFISQLSSVANINYSSKGDFIVDDQYTIEVGGKKKTNKQIVGIEKGYIAADEIEYGVGNKIPLWLFGFLY
jgi:predicted AAA+ superfamily ATPase